MDVNPNSLKALRIKKGMSQQALATAIETTRGQLSHWETGHRPVPDTHIEPLIKCLECTPGQLEGKEPIEGHTEEVKVPIQKDILDQTIKKITCTWCKQKPTEFTKHLSEKEQQFLAIYFFLDEDGKHKMFSSSRDLLITKIFKESLDKLS